MWKFIPHRPARFAALVGGPLLLASACIFGVEPTAPTSPADAGDVESPRDGETTDPGDAEGDGSAGCNFLGKSEGVCSNGVASSGTIDSDVLPEDVDAGDCAPPGNYVHDEGGVTRDGGEVSEGPGCGDGLDNDCDGKVDEGCLCEFAGRTTGVCSRGLRNGDTGRCDPPKNYVPEESNEHCDRFDNDCDGAKNEGCACNFTGKSEGACGRGKVDDNGECVPPSTYEDDEQTCDGIDNDCDGSVDEGIDCTCTPGDTKSCYTGKPSDTEGTPPCQAGTRECTDEGMWGSECKDEVTPEEEKCGDDIDNDCDGTVDEGCNCNYTGSSEGVCGESQIGSNGECSKPEAYEANEETLCDDKDNDCDGKIDEGCACDYQGDSEGVCSNGIQDGEGNCQAPENYESDESICDGKDNDCDGSVDEGIDCSCTPDDTKSCYTGQPSETQENPPCQAGTRECTDEGMWADECIDEVTPNPEECDGVDNDCDGEVDENLTQECGKDQGVCKDAVVACSEGEYPTCDGDQYGGDYDGGTEESCNDGKDNDCDGVADCADDDCGGATCGPLDSGAECSSSSSECVEMACQDGEDNDGDGATDCLDSDCDYCGEGARCDSEGVCHETACDDDIDNDDDDSKDDTDAEDCRKAGLESCVDDSQCVSGHCVDGKCAQTIFVTGGDEFDGDLGGLQGAKQECMDAANETLPGEWRPVLSVEDTPAKDHLTVERPVYNTNGDKFSSKDLWNGTVDSAVKYDAGGDSVGGETWTGTTSDGEVESCTLDVSSGPCTCSDWTATNSSGGKGDAEASDASWIENTGASPPSCGNPKRIYCLDGQ